jgi:RNA polymerase sigma factor (sigma-70 family)
MPLTRQQFDLTMAAHEPRLRAQVLSQVGANQGLDIDELIQDVRIRLWRILSSEKTVEHLASYLRRTVVSVVIDGLRRRQARREDALDLLDATAVPGDSLSPERAADSAQRVIRAQAAIGAVHERRRLPAQLLLQGFTTQEMANMLGLTEATARNLAYRGVEEIAGALRAAGLEDWDE